MKKEILHLSFLVILSVSQCVADKDTVPVFILDFEKILTERLVMNNPLNKLSSTSFGAVIQNARKASKRVVVFIDKTLSTEDLSLKDNRGTDFPNLQTVLNKGYVMYYPAVVNPFGTLKKIMQPSYHNIFYMGNPEKELRDMDKKLLYLYIYFQSKQNMSRINALREHDYKIMATYKLLRQMSNGPIVGIYTALRNPVNLREMNRFIRARKSSIHVKSVIVVSAEAMYRFSGVHIQTPTHITNYDKEPTVGRETRSETDLASVLSYTDFEFEFKFSFDSNGWTLESVGLLEGGEEVGRTDVQVRVLWENSYMCSEPLVIINTRDLSIVTISQYQIEPRDEVGGTSKENRSFHDPVLCSPFFSVTIIESLLIISVMAFIFFSALSLMFSCKTMNRFEDPNSKAMVIVEN